jgi:hypothetical protein
MEDRQSDVTGTPSYSRNDTRAVNSRIASFRHTAAPRRANAVSSERPPISFAFAQPGYASSTGGGGESGTNWQEQEKKEKGKKMLDPVDEDSPMGAPYFSFHAPPQRTDPLSFLQRDSRLKRKNDFSSTRTTGPVFRRIAILPSRNL